MNKRGQVGEYLKSLLLPRLDFDVGHIQECSQNTVIHFPSLSFPSPLILFPHSLYMHSLFGGVVVRSRGGNSILTNLTQFVERLARGRVQPVKHWPLASGWEMGYGDGFGWGANMDFSFWRYSLWNLIFLMDCSDKANVQVAKNRVN